MQKEHIKEASPCVDACADPKGYSHRVWELEQEGLTTSDAQGVAEAEFMQKKDDDSYMTRLVALAKESTIQTALETAYEDGFEDGKNDEN